MAASARPPKPASVVVPVPAPVPTSTASTQPPAPDSKVEVRARFPPLVQVAEADLRGEEAVWLHAHGALFVDARRSAQYEQGHIPRARSLSAWEDGLADKIDQLSTFTADLQAPAVVYCSGGDCRDSHLVAQKLWQAGFRNLRIYVDGFPDWQARKLAVTLGAQP